MLSNALDVHWRYMIVLLGKHTHIQQRVYPALLKSAINKVTISRHKHTGNKHYHCEQQEGSTSPRGFLFVCLGLISYQQGDYQQAETYLDRTLTIQEPLLGSGHSATRETVNVISTPQKNGEII